MDSTIKKVSSEHSPRGRLGAIQLVSGKSMAMRMWVESPGDGDSSRREYETVGYVIAGRAVLELEGQQIELRAGDSWLVPPGAEHRYRILEDFRAVEATSPPAHLRDRDRRDRDGQGREI